MYIGLLIALYFAIITGYSLFHTCLTFTTLFFNIIIQNIKGEKNAPSLNPIKFIFSFLIEGICLTINNNIKILKHLSFPKQKLEKTPILLIHGYGQSKVYWYLFRFNLKRKYNGEIFTFNFTETLSGIPNLAKEVDSQVNYILSHTNNKNIIIIGHSMGGLVGSYYAEYLAKPNVVTYIFTIASPFYGTIMSKLGSGECVKQMARDSKFLKALRKKIKQSKNNYYHIATKLDNVIIPWQSTIPDFSTRNYKILDFYSHQSILLSKKTFNYIYNKIK